MNTQAQHLSSSDIDLKAEEVIRHFNEHAFAQKTSSIYQVIDGLQSKYKIPFHFNQDLGTSVRGKKILGRFDFEPRQILIDKILPHDSPRFRWTLCHEVGHLVLHRKLNPRLISRSAPEFIDTRNELRFIRTARRSELEWIEWQANQFAAALLLPRPILLGAVVGVQRELGITRLGSIYLDHQSRNIRDYISILRQVAERLNVSRTVLRIRLLNLGILTDATRRDHLQEALRSLFSEDTADLAK